MKKLLSMTSALIAAGAMHSHAIFGLGGHWAPSPGLEIKRSTDTVASSGTRNFIVDEKGTTGVNGFGLKIWIDALPFIDLEASSAFQFGEYSLQLTGPSTSGTQTIDVTYDLDFPFAPDKPVFARILNDVSVTYPFLELPPAVSLATFYAGAGMSYVVSTAVLDAEFAKDALTKSGFNPATATPEDAGEAIAKAIVDEGLNMGVGFHLVAGARVKPPIIPLAAYANVKYHFGGGQHDTVDGSSLTFELGGGLAF